MASTGATATLNAAGDLLDGNTADNSYGDIEGGGSIVLMAGGNINIDDDSLVSAHGTGTIMATAGGSISLLSTNQPGAALATQGGAITLTTGAGGTLTVNADAFALAQNSIDTTRSGGNGNVTINADHFILNAATDNIVAGTGTVTIQQVTGTEAIQLGTTTDAELDLSNAELGAITAGTLIIGATANTGSITVTAAASPTNVTTLELFTGGAITDPGGFTLDPPNLALSALSASAQPAPMITAVTNLVAVNSTSGGIFINNTGP